jgi:serine/threonine protein phosphatase PrpC
MEQSQDKDSSVRLEAAGATQIGKRRYNEDFVLVRDDLQLFLVADGAGGHQAGDVAAALAARCISNYIGATVRATYDKAEFDRFGLAVGARRLAAAIHKANRDILEIARSHRQHRGMGTTVVAASYSPRSGLMHVAHVGDSRCYRLRRGHLELLTQDHSLLTDVLEERPELDDAVLANLPKHVVTRALGMKANLRVSLRSHSVAKGDRFLLCSDGLTVPVAPSVIAETLTLSESPAVIVEKLLSLAIEAGGRDNVAALVIDCAGGPDITLPADPRRHAPETHPPPARPGEPSTPELLLLGIEEIKLDAEPTFRVVPTDSASEDLAEALSKLVKSQQLR